MHRRRSFLKFYSLSSVSFVYSVRVRRFHQRRPIKRLFYRQCRYTSGYYGITFLLYVSVEMSLACYPFDDLAQSLVDGFMPFSYLIIEKTCDAMMEKFSQRESILIGYERSDTHFSLQLPHYPPFV